MSKSSNPPPARHAKTAKTIVPPPPPREFRVGDEVAVLDNEKGGRVVAIFPLRDRSTPVSLVVFSPQTLSGYVAVESDECTLLAPTRPRDRFDIVDWRLFDDILQIVPLTDADYAEYETPRTEEMRNAMRRVDLAIEFAHRAADLIRQPTESTGDHGWCWSDDFPARRAIALVEHAEHMLENLRHACLCVITGRANDADLRAGGAS